MEERTYTFHEDPGHGWLEVSRADMQEFGVEGKISHCSYVDHRDHWTTAYLEEDCDADTFMSAAKQAGIAVTLNERYSDPCFVRELPNYPARADWATGTKWAHLPSRPEDDFPTIPDEGHADGGEPYTEEELTAMTDTSDGWGARDWARMNRD